MDLAKATVIAAVIGGLAVIAAAGISKFFEHKTESVSNSQPTAPPQLKQPPRKDHASQTQKDHEDPLVDQSGINTGNQVGAVAGSNNQVNQISGSSGVVINQLPPASPHPITSGMGLRWTADDFAETVRHGNLPAIKEYLNSKDGFDPNTLWNGSPFVVQLPIFAGTKNFPEILKLFRETGKLNWKEVDTGSLWARVYGHPITLQWALLQESANKNHPTDLKVLIDAGADPSELIADEVKRFNAPPQADLAYKGELTGRARDNSGARAEKVLAAFKNIGYPVPNTEQVVADASRPPKVCAEDIRSHHSLKELRELYAKPPQAPSQTVTLTWSPFQTAAWYLNKKSSFGPTAWLGDTVEYETAIGQACSE